MVRRHPRIALGSERSVHVCRSQPLLAGLAHYHHHQRRRDPRHGRYDAEKEVMLRRSALISPSRLRQSHHDEFYAASDQARGVSRRRQQLHVPRKTPRHCSPDRRVWLPDVRYRAGPLFNGRRQQLSYARPHFDDANTRCPARAIGAGCNWRALAFSWRSTAKLP